ncbi:sialic acid-binding Ig-like lectin 15 [Pristis pectinata]|uniref:sialic acid-binding Ig-like lectin 15 n=1 Tax=Pristis pectinata TaxID=685728 RepID=UPI00223CF8A8|nr:sialic acid-binding Ig-like lectin 15 [Pristis pectinata]
MLFLLLCAIILGVSADCKNESGWSMETPDKTTGREGKLLVLFCKFTHPHHEYRGNISIIWKEKNSLIFNYINYPLKPGFANQVLVNKEEHFQPLGNGRENDASIIIKHLKSRDTGKKYICRVELTEEPRAKFQVDHGALEVAAVQAFRGSSVIGKRGVSATLPCSFKLPNKNLISITILWMKGNPRRESVVFNHTRSHSAAPAYTDTVNEADRYKLVGNPDQGNASISVRGLRMNDTSDYFCHVWVRRSKRKTVTQDETRLQVVVPATILNLSVVTNVTGDTLMCRAEGEPPANITWIGPGNSILSVNSSEMRVIQDLEIHQTVGELLHPRLRGSYNCVAVNEHGTDTREIHLPEEGMNVLTLALYIGSSISAVVVLLIAFAVWSLKKDSRQRGSCVDSSAANDLRSEGVEPDLQLERDPIHNVVVQQQRQKTK